MFLDFGLEWGKQAWTSDYLEMGSEPGRRPQGPRRSSSVGAGPQAGRNSRSSLGPESLDAVETGGHSCVKASVQNNIGEKPCFSYGIKS